MVELILGKFSYIQDVQSPPADLAELISRWVTESWVVMVTAPVSLDSSADKTKEMDMKNSMYLKVIKRVELLY